MSDLPFDVEIPDLAEPITAYRAFTARPDGSLVGARGITWPDDAPLEAAHISPRVAMWQRFVHWLRRITVHPSQAVRPVLLLVGWVWLQFWVLHGSVIETAVIFLGVIGWHMAFDDGGRCDRCPSPPHAVGHPRLGCGIYAYRSLEEVGQRTHPVRSRLAAGRNGGVWPVRSPVYARVLVWGRVYEHAAGWRAQYARIESLYGDGREVRRAAARYGVPVESMPDESISGTDGMNARRSEDHQPADEQLGDGQSGDTGGGLTNPWTEGYGDGLTNPWAEGRGDIEPGEGER